MTNAELSREYANGATSGKGSNMFIDGQTIYSYGYHFPIARIIGANYAVFNCSTYSVSTKRQQGHVLHALIQAQKIIIEAPDCAIEKAGQHIKAQLDYSEKKKARAKALWTQALWTNEVNKYRKMLDDLNNLI